jgi:hypothetical protein
MMPVRFEARERAATLGTNPVRAITSSTRWRAAGLTFSWSLMTRDTVDRETPAILPMSSSVNFKPIPPHDRVAAAGCPAAANLRD